MFKNLSEKAIADLQMEQVEKWEEEDLLDKCVTTREGQPQFVFYEGPPTANGRPGVHHSWQEPSRIPLTDTRP